MKTSLIIVLSVLLFVLVLLRYMSVGRLFEGFDGGAAKSIIVCKADWCGHCKKSMPEFQKLLQASPITLKDGSKATVKILDADKDKSEISKYNIKGFPTVLIANGGQTTEYPGERTMDGILSFMNGM